MIVIGESTTVMIIAAPPKISAFNAFGLAKNYWHLNKEINNLDPLVRKK